MDIYSDNLVDLIGEKYFKLKKMHDVKWSSSSDFPISNSEGFIIALIHKKESTISEIAQHAQISRQAAHKNIKALVSKNLIQANAAIDNNRKKIIKLTPQGEACFYKNELIKEEIERDLLANLGEDDILQFKETLKKIDWCYHE